MDLPGPIVSLLDGSDLAGRVGFTVLVIASDAEGWPRVATVSVGEVLAPAADTVYLTLYSNSRTTGAIEGSGRALLLLVHDGVIHRIRLALQAVETVGRALEYRTTFRGTVVEVERDEVRYARVTHGIEFELVDHGEALARWGRQVDELQALAARAGAS